MPPGLKIPFTFFWVRAIGGDNANIIFLYIYAKEYVENIPLIFCIDKITGKILVLGVFLYNLKAGGGMKYGLPRNKPPF